MELIDSIIDLATACGAVARAVGNLIFPWSPLLAWVGFWLYVIDWKQLTPVLIRGGIISLLLIAVALIFVWGALAPPVGNAHQLLGLTVPNLVGKMVYVTGLVCIALLCGSVQLASGRRPDAD